ncbi:RDD family protein [Methylovirgula sp. 4M-Z18]|uniref:RDD family protein n=1 Tax=Methylovirgula sp. 4M-Z18 TaxID=2293567 RepID=UPI000E2EFD68|nr:RDD family protein [Methylovirgula sp. 4M-Z18]RFB80619.1 RDD family protein [Methylovirgula sp. 4M-Z18]
MSQFYSPAANPPYDLTGVRTRRLVAVCFDMLFVSAIVTALILVAGLSTSGLGFLLILVIPTIFATVGFFYNGFTMSGQGCGTWGQRLAGLEVRMITDGSRVPFLHAAAHGVLFYYSWMFPAVFLVTLIERDKRFLHDILTGVIVVRRHN